MKNAKKVLALLLCAVLLVGASVAGTLAFLTSQDEVLNTFTVGQVAIELHETNEKGRDNGTVGLDFHLLPGGTYDKDPTVTVLKDSEDCYVRVKVTVDVSESWTEENAKAAGLVTDSVDFATAFKTWANNFAGDYIRSNATIGFNTQYWEIQKVNESDDGLVNPTEGTITYMLTYLDSSTKNIVKKSASNTPLEPIFTDVVVPRGLTNAELALLAGMKIKVEAHAIQAEGFEAETGKTVEQVAWEAFDNPNP